MIYMPSALQLTSGAALSETAMWGPPHPMTLLGTGMAVYQTNLHKLMELKPDVILTQLQVREKE
jgi:hypothetical protein